MSRYQTIENQSKTAQIEFSPGNQRDINEMLTKWILLDIGWLLVIFATL